MAVELPGGVHVSIPVVRPGGRDRKIFEFVSKVLARILGADGDSV